MLLLSRWNLTRHIHRTITHYAVGLILKMLIMLHLIKLEIVFAWLFFHLLPKQLGTCLLSPLLSHILLSACARNPPGRWLLYLPPCFFPVSTAPLIRRLQNTEKSADEQLNMALPQGGKVTPVCEAVCVFGWMGGKCSKPVRGIKKEEILGRATDSFGRQTVKKPSDVIQPVDNKAPRPLVSLLILKHQIVKHQSTLQ